MSAKTSTLHAAVPISYWSHLAREMPPCAMRVAIIHYWLTNMRGGEKVLEQICEMFPEADIFTHVYDEKGVSDRIRKHRVNTTLIQSLPFAQKHYPYYLSLMPQALEQLDLSEYDLVISSEAGPAKGVITRPDSLHSCYCHSPMRYIWDQYGQYFRQAGWMSRLGMLAFGQSLRSWDVTSAARVDHFIANSNAVAMRIQKFWRRKAEVIPPPVDTARYKPNGDRGEFYLYVGEFVPYKRADLAIEACTKLGRRLIVIGDGNGVAGLKKIAGPTIEFLGRVPNQVLADHYANCKALLFPAEEDFGIVPVEALASGAPVIAFHRGGAKDYVSPGENGVFFDEQTIPSLVNAMMRFEAVADGFDPYAISRGASYFDTPQFIRRMQNAILEQMSLRADQRKWIGQLRDRWAKVDQRIAPQSASDAMDAMDEASA